MRLSDGAVNEFSGFEVELYCSCVATDVAVEFAFEALGDIAEESVRVKGKNALDVPRPDRGGGRNIRRGKSRSLTPIRKGRDWV